MAGGNVIADLFSTFHTTQVGDVVIVALCVCYFVFGASSGMTMVAGTPRSRAASAIPWAWLPEE